MAYFVISKQKNDGLVVTHCKTKQSLYALLSDMEEELGHVGFCAFFDRGEDGVDFGPEVVSVDRDVVRDEDVVLVIKGNAVEPRAQKVRVEEWWVD